MKEITNHERLRLLGILSIVLDAYENAIFTLSTDTCTVLYAKAFLFEKGLNCGICHYIIVITMLHRNKIKLKDVRIIMDLLYNIDVNLRYNYYCTIPEKCRTIRGVLSSLEKRKRLINKLISSLKNQ